VGQNPDIKKVLRDILVGLDKEKFMNLNMTMLDVKQLMDEVKEFVKEKRYKFNHSTQCWSLHTSIETFNYF
jgi:hypothetical protein